MDNEASEVRRKEMEEVLGWDVCGDWVDTMGVAPVWTIEEAEVVWRILSDLRVKVEEPVSRKDVLREVYEKVDTGLVRCELERWLREEIGDDS